MNILFLFIGIIIGVFLNTQRLAEKTRKAQDKINKTIKSLKSNKIESIKFKDEL